MRSCFFRLVSALLLAPVAGVPAEIDRKAANAADSPGQLRQLASQKQALLNQLLGDSLAVARINASGNAQAQQFMAGARERYMKGLGELDSGHLVAANELFSEAIWMLGFARRLAPDANDRAQEERARNSQLLASIDSLRRSYRNHLHHLARSENEDPGWRTVTDLIETAKAHARAERLLEANHLLLQAEYGLLEAFGAVLRSKTIDYTPHFSDVQGEFHFEFERNRSYGELVPIAIAELKPLPEAVKLIARYVGSNRTLRDESQSLAASRNFTAALRRIREGTAELQRALLAAGLAVPQEAKDK